MKHYFSLFVAMGSMALLAQGPRGPQNEDLAYIHSWEKTQKLQELLPALNLTQEQVDSFKALKAQADEQRILTEAQIAEVDAMLAETAAAIRAKLEAGGTLTDEDREVLQTFRMEFRDIHQEARAAMGEIMQAIHEQLTEAQIEALRAWAEANRPEPPAGEGGEPPAGDGFGGPRGGGPESSQGLPQAREGRGPGQHRGARILGIFLSDEFQALI